MLNWDCDNSAEIFGGASRARTDDLIVANDALSQLSYSPTLRDQNERYCDFSSVSGFRPSADIPKRQSKITQNGLRKMVFTCGALQRLMDGSASSDLQSSEPAISK
jgi:hypothetical protein